jgi:hypothetical protein
MIPALPRIWIRSRIYGTGFLLIRSGQVMDKRGWIRLHEKQICNCTLLAKFFMSFFFSMKVQLQQSCCIKVQHMFLFAWSLVYISLNLCKITLQGESIFSWFFRCWCFFLKISRMHRICTYREKLVVQFITITNKMLVHQFWTGAFLGKIIFSQIIFPIS